MAGKDAHDPSASSIRNAQDESDETALQRNPADEEAKLNIGLDQSFPSSDVPAITKAGSSEPASSSGFDEAAEATIIRRRERAYALWEQEGRPEGRQEDHWFEAGEDGNESGDQSRGQDDRG